jgi:hypothetical protein
LSQYARSHQSGLFCWHSWCSRWRVYAIDPARNRIAARRLDDGARAVFTDDYLSEYITYGYAVTVHSAQGVTADTAHAVLGENTTRALVYVAITRGRESNTAYFYQRAAGEAEHQHCEHDDFPMTRRGSSREAAQLLHNIIGASDERARTAHDVGATTEREHLSEAVGALVDRRTKATANRRRNYANWQEQTHDVTSDDERWRKQHAGAIVNTCGSRSLRGLRSGSFVGAFDEFAVLECCAGTNECDQVRRVDGAPA